jgi:hypothetical protein
MKDGPSWPEVPDIVLMAREIDTPYDSSLVLELADAAYLEKPAPQRLPPLWAKATEIIVANEAFDFAHGLSDHDMAMHSIGPRPEHNSERELAWQTAFNTAKKQWQNARRRGTYATLWSQQAPSSEAAENVARWWMPRPNNKA